MLMNWKRKNDKAMKKLFLFALFAALCCSCSENGTDGNASPALDPTIFPTEIKLSSDNLRFNIAGGENSINVYYYHDYRIEPNAQWQLTGGESWCKPSATSGGEYDSISFVVDKYAGTEKRTATFTISCGNIKTELTITQTGWTVINVEKVGTLKNMLSNLNEDDINALKITGTINDEDILIIRDLRRLKHLNIAELPLITFPIYSFQGLYLNSIILPNKLQIIEKGLLSRCSSLTSIEIPASVKTIGDGAFSGCSSLTSIEIPASVKTIGGGAFSGCSSLTSIEIPASVKTIGSSAFSGCSSLTSIEIPASVETIEAAAFKGCSKLATVTFEKGSQLKTIDGNQPSTYVYHGTFSNCTALTSIEIPASVETIKQCAFAECTSLTTVTFEKGSQLKTIEGGTDCKDTSGAFYVCTSLTSIEIPASVKTIGDGAFSGCSKLATVTFEKGSQLKTISEGTFLNCTSLTSIEIPASVETIETAAFSGCTSLKTVAFEKGSQLRLIKNDESYWTLNSFYGAFGRTSDLETVDMSECKYVWLIDKYTFSDSRIRLFKIGTNRPPQATKALHLGSPSILKVPSGSIDAYKTSDDWNMFGNILALGE